MSNTLFSCATTAFDGHLVDGDSPCDRPTGSCVLGVEERHRVQDRRGVARPGAGSAQPAGVGGETVNSFSVTPDEYYGWDPVIQDPATEYTWASASWTGAEPVTFPDPPPLPTMVLVLTCLATATTTDDCSGAYQDPADMDPYPWYDLYFGAPLPLDAIEPLPVITRRRR